MVNLMPLPPGRPVVGPAIINARRQRRHKADDNGDFSGLIDSAVRFRLLRLP
jgi:hypothetical protein